MGMLGCRLEAAPVYRLVSTTQSIMCGSICWNMGRQPDLAESTGTAFDEGEIEATQMLPVGSDGMYIQNL